MITAVLLMTSCVILVAESSYFRCPPCRGDKCNVDSDSCEFGTVTLCSRTVCGKGPGERCGGYQNILGKCAEGLHCDSCGYCTGCLQSSILNGMKNCYQSDLVMCYDK